MARSKAQVNIMRDKKGSAIMLLGLLFIFSFFVLSLIVLDFMILQANMDKSKDAVTAACLAGIGEINQEALGYNVLEIDADNAEAAFTAYLQNNIQGISGTPPVIEDFVVYNQGDLPVVCAHGNTLNDPSIHTVVKITLKRPVLSGLLGDNYTFKIHLDCNNVLE